MYLGIDTSSNVLCLGLWANSGLRESIELVVERDHTKRIIVELESFLKQHSVKKQDLAGIGVGLGPGSYTGMRVGIATAKGLSKGLNIPVSGYPSLEAMAARCLSNNEKAIIAIDARRDKFYYGVYQNKNGQLILNSKIAKEAKTILEESHAQLDWYEGIVPDASYLAKQTALSPNTNAEAIYL